LSTLLVVIVFHQSLNLSVRPLLDVQNAFNKVRWPGIATLISGGASLGLAVLLAIWGKWGAVGVALAVAVAWTAKNALYMPVYTARIMELPWWAFLPTLSASVIGTLFVGLVSYGLTLCRMPDNWLTLAGSGASVSLVYTLGVWAIGLNRADRQLLRKMLPFQDTGTEAVLLAK
jgi:membrane protein EpsK